MKQFCTVCKIAGALVIVGALNWGLIGVFNFNLVSKVFGEMSLLSRVIYALVGIAGLMELVGFVKACPKCQTKK